MFTMEEELAFAGHPALGATAALHQGTSAGARQVLWRFHLKGKDVRVQKVREDSRYGLQDLKNFHVLEDSPESTRHIGDSQTSSRRIPAGHRSQSEADWAYAKRALARGDDPELVIHRIADFRSEDKK
jgi:predicted PhzF superfamily epimerase YddE/YHI9